MKLFNKKKHIESWFEAKWLKITPPLYGSVDIRPNAYKISPVNMNCFPAGFNNLNQHAINNAISSLKQWIKAHHPTTQKIAIIPENHTRNMFYLENISVISEIFLLSGFDVSICSLDNESTTEILLPSGKIICLFPFHADDYDLIVLNNDFSSGIHPKLQVAKTPIVPSPHYAWSERLKSNHFKAYEKVVKNFAAEMNIDPWLISAYYRYCSKIDFLKHEGISCIANHAENLLNQIQKKYDQYQIDDKPFVVIKADNGTYGMSVMMVDAPNQLYELNRKQRTKMSATKGSNPVNRVILQEGIYSTTTFNKKTAEPVIYSVGKNIVGGFYRIHDNKKPNENLNSPGMYFEPIKNIDTETHYLDGVIARLSLLATTYE